MALIKTPEEIEKIRIAGKILAKTIQQLSAAVEEGMTLKDLDGLAKGLILKFGGQPAFLNYRPEGASKPYPATLCASLNSVVVHGVPDTRRLKSGDLLKLDLGVRYAGYCADAAITVGIGEIGIVAGKLIKTTKAALDSAIIMARSGKTLGDIGYIIKKTVTHGGFKVVKGLMGHGIGQNVHEPPDVFNEGIPRKGIKLAPGMVLAIEPMVSVGSDQIRQLSDESYATTDGSLSAHFEHTIVITEGEAEIVTKL